MRYPVDFKNIIDITKAPYFADNTGKIDCTSTLRQVFDDILIREIQGVRETEAKLHTMGENNVYIGFETRIEGNKVNVIYPEFVPEARIIFFPKGEYLVNDTVTYTLDNLKNILQSEYYSELARGIHLMGEDRDNTVIRLCDNSDGFGENEEKPVISFSNAKDADKKFSSNVCQMNTLTDLTIDCGKGNKGAIGIRYMANNSGRVENIRIKGENSKMGLQILVHSQGVFRDISIEGFDYGIVAPKSCLTVLDRIDFKNIEKSCVCGIDSIMLLKNIRSQKENSMEFCEGKGSYVLFGGKQPCNLYKNDVCYIDDKGKAYRNEKVIDIDLSNLPAEIPKCEIELTAENYAYVDDFGAIGDGKTDSTKAIQSAMDSGKPIIIFGSGHYFVSGNINIPGSVKKVDFMFCDFFAGKKIISGECPQLFTVNEDSEEPLFIEKLYAYDQFYGFCRLICHNAKRDLIMSDLHTQAAAMYYNTVEGSNVYIDNCACTTGDYSCDAILRRPDYIPQYCKMIPFEFHGQKVLAYNLNPERADIEILNDASELIVYGLKVEGPGTAVKTINGGKSRIFVARCGIGRDIAENALFENDNSSVVLMGAIARGCREDLDYNCLFETVKGDRITRIYKKELEDYNGYEPVKLFYVN